VVDLKNITGSRLGFGAGRRHATICLSDGSRRPHFGESTSKLPSTAPFHHKSWEGTRKRAVLSNCGCRPYISVGQDLGKWPPATKLRSSGTNKKAQTISMGKAEICVKPNPQGGTLRKKKGSLEGGGTFWSALERFSCEEEDEGGNEDSEGKKIE